MGSGRVKTEAVRVSHLGILLGAFMVSAVLVLPANAPAADADGQPSTTRELPGGSEPATGWRNWTPALAAPQTTATDITPTHGQRTAKGGIFIFFDQLEFETFVQEQGKVLRGAENFEPPVSNLGPGDIATLADPLQGGVPNVDPSNGLGFPNGLSLFNLVIQSNVFTENPPNPAPGAGMVAVGPSFVAPGVPNSVKLGAALFAESLDLIFAPGDPPTGVGFTVEDPISGLAHISVFDINNQEIFRELFSVPQNGNKFFFGIWTPQPIGRINVGGPGSELVDNIQKWRGEDPLPCPAEGDCFEPHPTPGCDIGECCETVCAIDPFCCEQFWDPLCVQEAFDLCDCTDAAQCDDQNPCTLDDCVAGDCVNDPLPEGDSCDLDGSACTLDECDGAGQCIAGGPVFCDPPTECDGGQVCDPGSGLCEDLPDTPSGTPCTGDGDLCITSYACDGSGDCLPVGEVMCPVGQFCQDGICVDKFVKWSQLPHGELEGFNVESDLDWQTLAKQPAGDPGPGPNVVTADDFQSDGRPITWVRWWGSYLDPQFEPGAGSAMAPPVDGAAFSGSPLPVRHGLGQRTAGTPQPQHLSIDGPGWNNWTPTFQAPVTSSAGIERADGKRTAKGGIFIFFDQLEFEAFVQDQGKVLRGAEDFEPPVSNLGPGDIATLADPLQGGVPNIDPGNGLGFPNGLSLFNLVLQSNFFTENPPMPAPGAGMVAVGPGFIAPGIPNSVKLGAALFAESLDLIFDPGDLPTGVGFTVEDPISGLAHISVFDMNNQEIFRELFTVPQNGEKFFFGIWTPQPIGRINVGGPGSELVDNIQKWSGDQTPSCPGEGDCFNPHNNPGCETGECCEAVCAIDPFCCEQLWDPLCVQEAFDLCAGTEVDGWLVSFHTDLPADQNPQGTFSQPLDLLGLYYCSADVVTLQPTGVIGWDGHQVYEYVSKLSDCCLVHSDIDPRDGSDPAQPQAFNETEGFIYWLDIQAVVGHTLENQGGLCVEIETPNRADDPFWGWHTSPMEFNDVSTSGVVLMGPSGEWLYDQWLPVDGSEHMIPSVHQAFELLTPEEPADPCDLGTCFADLTGDGVVNAADLAQLLGNWGNPGCGGVAPCCADLNGDGAVNAADLAQLLGNWGPCPV